MSMFCYQCQEAAGGKGCTTQGVCGKNAEVSNLQDLLIYVVKGIAAKVMARKLPMDTLDTLNREVTTSLFMTITNANFDDAAIARQISRMLTLRDALPASADDTLPDAATFQADTLDAMRRKATTVGVLATGNEDVRSLREMILYVILGIEAYTDVS